MPGAWTGENLFLLLDGFWLTIRLTLLTGVASLVLGTCVGLARASPRGAWRLAGAAYVEFLRNVPPLILLFLLYFGLPRHGIRLDAFTCGGVALTLYTAAFVAEAVRAGIAAVDRGQFDAARSLGFSYSQAMRFVAMPQAIAIVLPALGNIAIGIVKNTALVSTIGVADLMFQGELIETRTFATFSTFSTVAAIYLALIIPLSFAVGILDRRRQRMTH